MFHIDSDIKACCKEIYLFVSGPADLTQFILVGQVILPFAGGKIFCTWTFSDGRGDFVATASSFPVHSASPVTRIYW